MERLKENSAIPTKVGKMWGWSGEKAAPAVRGLRVAAGVLWSHPITVYSGKANRVLAEPGEKELIETDPHLSTDALGIWKGAA